jgi:drug/metabolite transporter (DMT)-like permease
MTGFVGVVVPLTYGMTGMVLTCWRLWLGALFLLVVTYTTGRRLNVAVVRAAVIPSLFLTADFAMFFCSLKLTSVVDATVLGAMQPALVMLIARRMFHERLRPRDVWWIAIAIAGVTLAVLGPGARGPHAIEGDMLAVGAMLMWTGYWLSVKRVRATHEAMTFTTSVMTWCALFIVPIWLATGQSVFRSHASDWKWVALVAVVPSLGHIVLNYAQRYVAASISSAIGCLNPLVASVAAVPLAHQALSPTQIAGVAVGVGAVTVIAANNREPSLDPPTVPEVA